MTNQLVEESEQWCQYRVLAVYLALEIAQDRIPPIPAFVYIHKTKDNINSNMSTHAGRKKGRGNYSHMELNSLLDTMEDILPIGSEEWQRVVEQHNENYPSSGRDAESIRRKYATLHRKKVPTGDPMCPLEVKKAKRIKYQIGAKADLGDVEEEVELKEEPPLQEQSEVEVDLTNTAKRSTPVKRSYSSRTAPDENVVSVLTALLKQNQANRDEDRKQLMAVLNTISGAVTTAFNSTAFNSTALSRAMSVARPKKKRKMGLGSLPTRRCDKDLSSSDSDDSI